MLFDHLASTVAKLCRFLVLGVKLECALGQYVTHTRVAVLDRDARMKRQLASFFVVKLCAPLFDLKGHLG